MREIVNFNEKWAFSKESKDIPKIMPNNWYFVNLPHTWNNIDGQDGGDDYYRGSCLYAKKIIKSCLPVKDEYYLEFCGANASSDVYIDGKHIAHHDGGYSTWRVDITDYLTNENLLVVKVDNGKNDKVYPQMADFTFYGGLYRDVNIIAVNKTHFALDYYGTPGIKVTPVVEGNIANVEVEIYVSNEVIGQELVYIIMDADKNLIFEKTVSVHEKNINIEIPNVHLWNGVEDPYLYNVEVLLKQEQEILDSVSTRFGCRSFSIDSERGFILNGREYPLRGVSRHQDRWGIGNALAKEHHKEDMDLICEMGANTIRLAHYQHDGYFYDLCDERGIVVWSEIPYISSHMPNGRENTISQMKELIIQNYNHPSIVVWGLSNEITIDSKESDDLLENHKILNNLVHELDKTRLTTIAAVSTCPTNHPYLRIPNVISYNHYFGWYGGDVSQNGEWLDKFHKEYPNIPIGISEYGCEALNWHTSNPTPGDYTEEYQAYYHEELIKQIWNRPYLWATHVWNMFDFGADSRNEGGENGQNHKGLVTFDRKYKKDAFYAYKAWMTKEPFIHICGKRYINRVEDATKITVYSNLPEVELFVNGKSIGTRQSKDHFFYFDVPNIGKSHIVAKSGIYQDESDINKVDKFDDNYMLKEQGVVLNWFDITSPSGYYSLNDKISDIKKSKEANNIYLQIMEYLTNKGGENNDNMMAQAAISGLEMLDGFSVLRLINMAKLDLDKETLLNFNSELNNIKK